MAVAVVTSRFIDVFVAVTVVVNPAVAVVEIPIAVIVQAIAADIAKGVSGKRLLAVVALLLQSMQSPPWLTYVLKPGELGPQL